MDVVEAEATPWGVMVGEDRPFTNAERAELRKSIREAIETVGLTEEQRLANYHRWQGIQVGIELLAEYAVQMPLDVAIAKARHVMCTEYYRRMVEA